MGKNVLQKVIEKFFVHDPIVRLSSEKIREEVMKMEPGDKKTFNFDPDDPKLSSSVAIEMLQAEISMATKYSLSGSIDVDEKKGKYQYSILVIGRLWK